MTFNINNIKRKTIKCQICYSNLLGDVSDIEDKEERFEKMMIFCDTLQDIVRRETTIEMLKNWRKSFKKQKKKRGESYKP